MAEIIPVTVTLEGGPCLQPMVVSASQIHRVVKSKDLNKLAKQMLKERTERWRRAKLKRKFPKPRPLTPPPPQTDTPPPPQTDTPSTAAAAASSPPLEDSDDDADLQPSPLKFTRKKESYQVIPEQGEPTGTAQPIGWDDTGLDNGIQVTAGVKQEDEADELLSANSWVPVIPTPSNASSSPEEEEDAITPAEMLTATTNVPMPCALDLSQISPKPVYVPEEQPDHLKHSTVKRQEKTALQRYEEEQEDAKEVIGKGNEKFISTMYDPEGIISARPDGQVILTDDTKGVIEIKNLKNKPTSSRGSGRERNKVSRAQTRINRVLAETQT